MRIPLSAGVAELAGAGEPVDGHHGSGQPQAQDPDPPRSLDTLAIQVLLDRMQFSRERSTEPKGSTPRTRSMRSNVSGGAWPTWWLLPRHPRPSATRSQPPTWPRRSKEIPVDMMAEVQAVQAGLHLAPGDAGRAVPLVAGIVEMAESRPGDRRRRSPLVPNVRVTPPARPPARHPRPVSSTRPRSP